MLKIIPIDRINSLLSALKSVVLMIIAIISLSLKVCAAMTNYYVGGTGASDNHPGTSSHPFATIQVIPGVTDGFVGTTPDVGAYEYLGKNGFQAIPLLTEQIKVGKSEKNIKVR